MSFDKAGGNMCGTTLPEMDHKPLQVHNTVFKRICRLLYLNCGLPKLVVYRPTSMLAVVFRRSFLQILVPA